MTAAEQVTMLWMMSQGFFVMPSVKQGRQEVDLLGLRLDAERKDVQERVHTEVQVSSRPWGSRQSEENYRQAAEEYVKWKFDDPRVKSLVERILGSSYSRWVVVGKSPGGEAEERVRLERMAELGVRLIPFQKVVSEYVRSVTSRPSHEMGDLLDILNALHMLSPAQEN